MKLHLIIIFLAIICISCNNTSSQKENCKKSYDKAISLMKEYYQHNDKELVHKSLSIVDSSIKNCEDDTLFIFLKLNILNILEDYENGYLFVDTLDANLFGLPYQKMMFFNHFKACTISDSLTRVKYSKQTVSDIEKYLSEHPNNQEAIMDLIAVKSKYLERDQILAEIDEMSKSYEDKEFFEGLRNSYEFDTHDTTNIIKENINEEEPVLP